MSDPRYIVGIDLGTTHCVVAYTRAAPEALERPEIRLFEIPQVVSPGEVQARPLLPSFLFLPGPHDVPEGGLALPWKPDAGEAVGEYARERGAEIPNRLVASAKSWLSHTGVDRTAPILPWDAPGDARRVSPVEAATRYLAHIREAWNHVMAAGDPQARLEEQEVYLTVPASFDAVARELTVQAARAAGLEKLTLLEEPQAAFYAWLEARGDAWREEVHVGESILVCDVGGGTTDFSLIEVVEEDGNLDLRRAAVGDHILLGGDNMDLTLAYAVRARLAQEGTRLDNWQFRTLVHGCRKAKEHLLGHPDLEAVPVVIPGRGSALIGGTIRTELTRQEIEAILVQGFFPETPPDAFPERRPKVGMREMGLPYESDPAITRHLAYFLHRQVAGNGEAGVAFPSAVLFNGGVMKAGSLREQVLRVLRQWSSNDALRALPSVDLDQAVAIGAAYYGLARKGRGIRIRAGTARSYYIGIESAMPAVPGIPAPMKALCVVPFGMEEGTEADIRGREFGLVVGEQAVFHLLASNTRKTDPPGEIIEDWDGELAEVITMETTLPATDAEGGGTVLPVWLHSKVTEIGTLELWCVARDGDRRWKLEFNLRDVPQEAGGPAEQHG
ncbi:Hsp70 family protein [Rhodocaloribacter litoris]|uniref:Hsp70 family protein n=1 Tax=Rhodocaloribacter litoris TaxID=2558931 RepID=UPI00141DD142|nr:Hsp70 family protein [Rhodocaloribacter litoris]QXD14064.1 Hsp70 family protein [Rhodocaloribacter litoris]GIV60783.1 MAG: heat-shock protein [Rhodothermaceae bacterium]